MYVLLPISVVVGLVLVSQGVIQSLSAGPVASQEVIKELGTNGGGFFNVNSAYPFENPTWLSNFIEMLLILAIPAALTSVYGRMVGNRRQGWAIYSAMLILFVIGVVVVGIAENHGTPAMEAAGVHGFNMEGKEQRFGIASTALFTVITTVASCGAVNGAMESLTGIGGLVPMANMQTGEVIFGGVGSGLYGMLMFAILGVFLSGLMVGRTPEFLGKKIEAREVKLTVFGTIGVPLLVLVTARWRSRAATGRCRSSTPGRKAGRRRSTPTRRRPTTTARRSPATPASCSRPIAAQFGITFANLLGGVTMMFGRFLPLLAALAIAGSLVREAGDARRPRHLPHRLPDLRRRPGRRDRPDRAPDLRPRPAPRPRGPGHDPPTLLMRELRNAVIAVVVITVVLGLAYPVAMTGAGPSSCGRTRPTAIRR